MLSFALGAGVPRSSIELLEQGAINTIEIAISTKQLLTKWVCRRRRVWPWCGLFSLDCGMQGLQKLSIVTSAAQQTRTQTIFNAIMPSWSLQFHSCSAAIHPDHVERIAKREQALLAVTRDDLERYFEYLDSRGVWPPLAKSWPVGDR